MFDDVFKGLLDYTYFTAGRKKNIIEESVVCPVEGGNKVTPGCVVYSSVLILPVAISMLYPALTMQ